ncbi:MAG: hypothetical protein EBX41_10570 [Chitinophagia bacterium]|nr:hypothetical protein [Chitinophagia bacterium]
MIDLDFKKEFFMKIKVIVMCLFFLNACSSLNHPDDYGETGKNTAGGTCAYGVGGCTPDEDKSGDFVNY